MSAEVQFVHFIAEYNLPSCCGDHFTKLVKFMFPDSDIAHQFQCSRTKTMVLAKHGNSKYCQDQLIETMNGDGGLGPMFYSILIDESNDRGVEAKDLVVMVRFFDPRVMKAVIWFVTLPKANNRTAAGIFEKLDECLQENGIKYSRLLAFNSVTCNTMKGQCNGVVKYLKEKQPKFIDFGYICHLDNLAIKVAVKKGGCEEALNKH